MFSISSTKKSEEQTKSEFQAPSEAEFEQAQSEVDRLLEEDRQQSQRILKEQQHRVEIKKGLELAEARLEQLRRQKMALEQEKQQTEVVRQLRAISERINEQSWQLGETLKEFKTLLSSSAGYGLVTSKKVSMDYDPQPLRRHTAINHEMLPFVFHQVGNDRFALTLRAPYNPGEGDRLAALRKAQGKG